MHACCASSRLRGVGPVATVSTDLATRTSRDSCVYVLAIQDHYNCEQRSERRGVLARVLIHSVVCTSGCRECESQAVVFVVFLGRRQAPTSWGPASGEVPRATHDTDTSGER